MEIKGKITHVLPLQSGTSKTGNEWKKQEFVLQTADQYPKSICFFLWGDKIDQYAINVDEEVIVSFDVESREYNGRWYTNVQAWKIDKVAAGEGAPLPPVGNTFDMGSAPSDDLPF